MKPTVTFLTNRINDLNTAIDRTEKELAKLVSERDSHNDVLKLIEENEHSNTQQDS